MFEDVGHASYNCIELFFGVLRENLIIRKFSSSKTFLPDFLPFVFENTHIPQLDVS